MKLVFSRNFSIIDDMNTEILHKIDGRVIIPEKTMLDAIKQMDEQSTKMLFVMNDGKFIGLLTIGDIQRAIIRNIPMNTAISEIIDTDKIYASPADKEEVIRERMKRLRAECMPVVDGDELIDVIFWKDMFLKEAPSNRELVDLPVVVMAGGKGTRLKPLTNIIPKPMIPIGKQTILEDIMDKFINIGSKRFFLSVNYKSEILQYYLNNLDNRYEVEVFKESKPLGTIGSVSMLKGKINSSFFVTNCDIIIDQDFRDVYKYHKDNRNDLTIVAAIKSYKIPYGVIETGEDGLMTNLEEKPEMTYMINTGVYILEPHLIDMIPENSFFHITDLMEKLRKEGGRIGCFPISEKSWTDIGEWSEYLKIIAE